jgi:LysM repeat protein
MQYSSQKYTKQISFSNALSKVVIFTLPFMICSFLYPRTASAGLFSFFSNLSGEEASAKIVDNSNTLNSQNMLVLHATVNSDPNPNKTQNDPILVLGDALVAEIGPSGTVSEVEEENTNTQISLYVVHEGDTLSKIAKMFGVTTNTIIWANDLGRDPVLKKDQKLIILPISGIQYTVKKGDTIKGIVSRYKTDLKEVLQFNDLTLSSVISTGDVIVIPDAEPELAQPSKILSTKKLPTNKLHDAGGPYYPGYYIRPIDGGYKSQGLHGYNAVDIATTIGTPIHAAAEGTVIASKADGGWHGGYGNYVIISHNNGTQTLYAHVLKTFVSVGDHVEQDQMIAKVGSTGNSTGPHVHFEIRGARNPF